jgi:hypothetical protein
MKLFHPLALALLLAAPPAAQAQPPASLTFAPGHVDSILGRPVLDGAGKEIGPVVDVLVDRRGHPRVAIVDVGGFLGIGTRRVAVGWETLRFIRDDAGAPHITEDLSMDEVAAAPEYKPGDGPIQAVGPRPAAP